MSKILNWILASSEDPSQLSLTVKGILVAVVPAVIFVSGLSGHQLDSDTLNQIVSAIASLIQVLGAAVAAFMFLYGLVRKVWHANSPVAPTVTTPTEIVSD